MVLRKLGNRFFLPGVGFVFSLRCQIKVQYPFVEANHFLKCKYVLQFHQKVDGAI
jgi:hypothetical protein